MTATLRNIQVIDFDNSEDSPSCVFAECDNCGADISYQPVAGWPQMCPTCQSPLEPPSVTSLYQPSCTPTYCHLSRAA
jgi:hypothetical protein